MKRLFFMVAVCFGYLEAQHDSSIVATVGLYQISSDDLLTSYEFDPAFVKHRREPLREHLKYMIYERLLAFEAERNRLNTAGFVQERIKALEEDGAVEQLYRQDILSHVQLSEKQIANETRKAKIAISLNFAQGAAVARTINGSDSVLNKYYSTHKKQYLNAQGKPKDYALVRESVKSDYFNNEESLLLSHIIKLLKRKYPVTINEELLQRLTRKIESDPRAIEIIFYKSGGTFPRVALTTIDESWSKLH